MLIEAMRVSVEAVRGLKKSLRMSIEAMRVYSHGLY
jgi:hypothetical protein